MKLPKKIIAHIDLIVGDIKSNNFSTLEVTENDDYKKVINELINFIKVAEKYYNKIVVYCDDAKFIYKQGE